MKNSNRELLLLLSDRASHSPLRPLAWARYYASDIHRPDNIVTTLRPTRMADENELLTKVFNRVLYEVNVPEVNLEELNTASRVLFGVTISTNHPTAYEIKGHLLKFEQGKLVSITHEGEQLSLFLSSGVIETIDLYHYIRGTTKFNGGRYIVATYDNYNCVACEYLPEEVGYLVEDWACLCLKPIGPRPPKCGQCVMSTFGELDTFCNQASLP